MPTLYVGDFGTIIKATIKKQNGDPLDISTATTLQIKIKPPTGPLVTKTGTLFTNGQDGVLYYATISGDIAVEGEWRAQGYVVLPTGRWHSNKVTFYVQAPLA